MRVLLPPSESKRPDGGNAIFTADTLHAHHLLSPVRQRVTEAVQAISADPERSRSVFKLGVKAEHELLHNVRLDTAHGLPAIERYVGVLFDEITYADLGSAAQRWINAHVFIQSALFGIISSSDEIPPYRLSASTRLTEELGHTLKRTWNEAFRQYSWPDDFILDLRSKDYAALAPLPENHNWLALDIVQRTEDGGVRALNHFNKRAKGDLVKRLALSQPSITDAATFIAWADRQGIEVTSDETPHHATLITALGAVHVA